MATTRTATSAGDAHLGDQACGPSGRQSFTHTLAGRWTALALAIASFVAAPVAPSRAADTANLFTPNQRIGFFGDSITHNGIYHQVIQLYLATRFPGRNIQTFNYGISGDTATGGLKRMQWDMLDETPDLVFVHFGMNDVRRDLYKNVTVDPSDADRKAVRDGYAQKLQEIVGKLQQARSGVVILSPTIFDDRTEQHAGAGASPYLDAELVRFGQIGKAVADRHGVKWIDLHAPIKAVNEREQAKDPKFSLTIDRVHPRRGGEEIIAHTILKAFAAPEAVYDVAIAAGEMRVERQRNAEVADLKRAGNGLRFRLSERALPYPIPDKTRGQYAMANFAELNRQTLSVAGLPAGDYGLLVDDVPVAQGSADDFRKGIDLATNPTMPGHKLAAELGAAVLDRKFELERQVRLMKINARGGWRTIDAAKAVADIDAEIVERKSQNRYRGYAVHTLTEGRDAFLQREAILLELSAIHERLATVPATVEHRYEIRRVAAR